jgi:hypothetical protein
LGRFITLEGVPQGHAVSNRAPSTFAPPANILRGKTAGQAYKYYILSLMFYKRLCDQLS